MIAAPRPAASASRPALGAGRLACLLIGLRLRTLRGRLQSGPRVAAARFAALFAVILPIAYVGLFSVALAELGAHGGQVAEHAALALLVTGILSASLLGKVAAAELVVGRAGEVELLLACPVSLPRLVVARALSGIASDLFAALFLLPVLAAAAIAWNLGIVAIAVSVLISLVMQLAVAALAEAGQIAIAHFLPPAHRRGGFVLAALGSAAALAALWMLGTTVLRSPELATAFVTERAGLLQQSPGGWVTAPLRALRAGEIAQAVLTLLALTAGSLVSLVLAALVARLAARHGWEQTPALTEGAEAPSTAPVGSFSLVAKDWRLLVRDRVRLVTLVALPLLFVGVQAFGSAGLDFATESPARIALVAFSLAAYAATFGPLVHLEAERKSFWLLRTVPVSLGAILAKKAIFWSAVLGGFALASYLALVASREFSDPAEIATQAALVLFGAVVVTWLAIGLGASEADLSDDQRPAVGIGTAYLFMLVAGLYNLVLTEGGRGRVMSLALFVVVSVIAFLSGVRRARDAFDPDAFAGRHLAPVAGALGMILLHLGGRAVSRLSEIGGSVAAESFATVWLIIIALFASVHRLRNRPPTLGYAVSGIFAIANVALLAACMALTPQSIATTALAVGSILVAELLARGIVQAGLDRDPADAPLTRSRWRPGGLALAAGAALIVTTSPDPFTISTVLSALLPGLAMMATGRLGASIAGRLVIALGAAWWTRP